MPATAPAKLLLFLQIELENLLFLKWKQIVCVTAALLLELYLFRCWHPQLYLQQGYFECQLLL